MFTKLDIDTSMIRQTFAIGEAHLGKEKGVIMQLFDTSHFNPWQQYYNLTDKLCGTFSPEPVSKLFLTTFSTPFPNQIRLLMSNRHTLNPYSSLVIKRYDSLDPQIVKKYETELRAYIKNFQVDKEKAELYKQELLNAWEVNDEMVK